MMGLKNSRYLFLAALAVIALSIGLCGCGASPGDSSVKDTQVVARINAYKMTVADFKDEVELVLSSKFLMVEPNEAKDDLLDELLTRNVLLQEAQRQNLDKQTAFMKEIEGYWEQSLLKLLLEKKTAELAENIVIDDSEVINEYRKMQHRVRARLLMFSDQAAAQRLAQAKSAKFPAVLKSVEDKVISGHAAQWWSLGDLPNYLEDALFALRPGQLSPVIKCGQNWAVIKVLEEEKIEIEPFRKLTKVIRSNIHKRKKEAALDAWIATLRRGATVKVDKKVLRAINLK
ncbi:peptidyl-prolyl cis-trans isomerase [Candidatus Omnitrophota bacterium]